MRVINCEQGGKEWHQARAGVITASMFRVARERIGGLTEQQQKYVNAIRAGKSPEVAQNLAEYKTKPRLTETVQRAIDGLPIGDYSEAAKNYAFRLAVERISGTSLDEGFETWAMKRGHELEPQARAAHEAASGDIVFRAGFVVSDCGKFGASADGLIDDDAGSEYKCLVSPEGLRDVLVDNDISKYIDQVQGCMWITGRTRWHFCMYCPALAPIGKELYWRVIERDDDYIEAMEADLIEFMRLVDAYEQTLSKDVPQVEAGPLVKAERQQAEDERQRLEAEEFDRVCNGQDAQLAQSEAEAAARQWVERVIEAPVAVAPEATAPATGPMLKLGEINARLAPISITVDGLAQLGFTPAATDKASRLYRASDMPLILAAMVRHINGVGVSLSQAA